MRKRDYAAYTVTQLHHALAAEAGADPHAGQVEVKDLDALIAGLRDED